MKRLTSLVTTMALLVSLSAPVVADDGTSPVGATVDGVVTTSEGSVPVDAGEDSVNLDTEKVESVVVDEKPTTIDKTSTQEKKESNSEVKPDSEDKQPSNTDDKSDTDKSNGEGVKEEAEKEPEVDKETDKEDTAEDEKTDVKVKDNSNRVVKSGMNVKIFAHVPNPEEYVPTFNLYLTDTKNNLYGKTSVGKQNYSVEEGAYNVTLKHDGYKKGDKFRIHIREADNSVVSLTLFSQYFKDNTEEMTSEAWELKNNQHFEGQVREVVYTEDDESLTKDIEPSNTSPIMGELKTNPNLVVFDVEDDKGKDMPNLPVKFLFGGGEEKAYKTDASGKIWLDKTKLLSEKFAISSEGYSLKNEDSEDAYSDYARMIYYPKNLAEGYTFYNVSVAKKQEQASGVTGGSVNVTPKVDGNTELTDLWVNGDLVFKSSDGVEHRVTVNKENVTLQLPNGKYKVSAVSKDANIKLSSTSVTVNNKKVDLSMTFSPKYIFEVGKQGKPFKFKVLNVESVKDKVFSGTGVIKFGVVSGQSFMVQDLADNKIYSVVIDDNSNRVSLVLGVGVVFGSQDAINPHTGDAIVYLTILLMVSLVASGIFFFLYRKGKGYGTKALASVLIFGLISSTLVMGTGKAEAATGGTIGSGTGGNAVINSGIPTGAVLTTNHTVLQVALIPANSPEIQLKENSSKADLASSYKFSYNFAKRSFFIAPNAATHKLLVHSKSSYALLNESGLINTIYGKHPFTATPSHYTASQSQKEFGIKGSLASRTFTIDEGHYVFGSYIARMVQDLGKNINTVGSINANYNTNQQLYKGNGSTSIKNIGDVANNVSKELIYKWLNSNSTYNKKYGKIVNDSILHGYADKLDSIKQHDVAKEVVNYINGDGNAEYAFMFQTVQGFQVQNKAGNGTMFMPLADAVRWYTFGRQKTSPNNNVHFGKTNKYHQEQLMFMKRPDGVLDSGYFTDHKLSKVYPLGNYLQATRPGAVKSIKPRTSKVPIKYPTNTATNIKNNPFAGWGFLTVVRDKPGPPITDGGNDPTLSAVINIKYKDNGVTKTHSEAYPLFEGKSKISLSTYLLDRDLEKIPLQLQSSFKSEKDGTVFALSDTSATVTLRDNKKDKEESLLKYKGLAIDMKVPTTGVESIKARVSKDGLNLLWDYDIPKPIALYTYLNGWGSVVSPLSTTSKKLYDVKYSGKTFSNAVLTITVEGDPVTIDNKPATSNASVPQWRLSKYEDDIAVNGTDNASFSLNIPNYTGRNPVLSPSGNTSFSLVSPSLKDAPWAISKAKAVKGETYARNLGVYSYINQFAVTGDLLAIKDNTTIGGVKLASWKNNFNLFGGKIGTTTTGTAENKPKVTKNYQFAYGVKSPTSSYKLYSYSDKLDKDGKVIGTNTHSYNVGTSYSTAKYNTAVTFDRYVPANSSKLTAVQKVMESANGKYWETYQDKQVLNVNPEVVMAYDDVAGNTSVAVVAGDKLRQVKPVHYNVAQYRNLQVDPQVEGLSVATDVNAKALAKRLGASDKGVVYKGSSTTTNFGVQGEMVLKTYALDIGSSSLKNVWSNSTYSTDKVNEEFLARHATKKPDGTWELPIDANGKLKINGKEYGGQNKKLVGKQKNVTTVEHTLVVRGGKLVSVNGNTNLSTLEPSLKEALLRMNISTAKGDNVFNTFESRKGNKIGGDTSALNAINMIRNGDTVTANEGWYNEDTTVMVVREYINTFELPNFMYVDKVPMEIAGIETPIDKLQYFKKGYVGHTVLSYKVKDIYMTHDSSNAKPIGGSMTKDYVVPNVSVLDSAQF